MTGNSSLTPEQQAPGSLVGNLGGPIFLKDLQLDGVSATTARPGDTIQMITRLCLTSDDPFFHKVADGLAAHVEYRANESGVSVKLAKSDIVLLVVHPDHSGMLWLDTAAVDHQVRLKRSVNAGDAIFENDIADITAMRFPFVEIKEEDRVLCLFRVGWKFGLLFDFNPDKNLLIQQMEVDLGTLYRRLKYCRLYDMIENEALMDGIVVSGWFPFVELSVSEIQGIADFLAAKFDLSDIESSILSSFDDERVEKMFSRWMTRSHLCGREAILRSAVNNFKAGDSVAVLKIVLTEIEGILRDAYIRENEKSAKIDTLLEFAKNSAMKLSGQKSTLFFPEQFQHYLAKYVYANFDPVAQTENNASRHSVGHGASAPTSYTRVRALQALLTIDQLAFYI